MNKFDLFEKNDTSTYLYNEIEKIRTSMHRREKTIFNLIKEIEDQLLLMQKRVKGK